ncbi:ASST-domain-containing protein [Aspergillus unguis]
MQFQSVLLALFPAALATTPRPWPTYTFQTTNVTIPFLNTTKTGPTTSGLIFIAPSTEIDGSPAIYTDDGDLVWHGPEGKTYAYQPQTLHNEPVLTFWQGHNVKGFGYGHISILNASYDEIHRVTLPATQGEPFITNVDEKLPSFIDIHESAITEDNTILVTAVNNTQTDLSAVGGPKDGWVQDGLVYEIDIATNEVLFKWSAVEHKVQLPLGYLEYPLGETGRNSTMPYQYPHLNSIAKYGDHYLVSSRYMCVIFLLDRKGDVVWVFHGQQGGTYTLPSDPGARFCYQHDPRIHQHTNRGTPHERITLSLHNNDNTESTLPRQLTTVLKFDLFPYNKTSTLLSRDYDHKNPVSAVSQGSYQSLSSDGNGHYLAGHGAVPKIEEFDEAGNVVMRGWFGAKTGNSSTATYDWTSYRAYRAEWTGKPRTLPSVKACVEKSGGDKGLVQVYVSWNGATDVEEWRIWGGSRTARRSLRPLDSVKKRGFETRAVVEFASGEDSVVVEAIGGVGDGTRSKIVKVESC